MYMLDRTVGEIVAHDYRTSKVFEKYGIDFCCGGNMLLSEVCNKEGLAVATITKDIEKITREPVDQEHNYSSWDIPFLVDYIINVHHRYINENIGEIKKHINKIVEVHGNRHPELSDISSDFDTIVNNMRPHLKEEEEVLFPALKRVVGNNETGSLISGEDRKAIVKSLKNLSADHEIIGEIVHRINHLTAGYEVPEGACNTFNLTYKELKEFEKDLHKHVHLENNILFLKIKKML